MSTVVQQFIRNSSIFGGRKTILQMAKILQMSFGVWGNFGPTYPMNAMTKHATQVNAPAS